MGSINWVGLERQPSRFTFMPDTFTAIASQIFGDGYVWHDGHLYCRVLSNSAFEETHSPVIQSDWICVSAADGAEMAEFVPSTWVGTHVTHWPDYQFYAAVVDEEDVPITRASEGLVT